ncbi:hypothetical protein HXX76_012132 [Chlamydomonas incerta]|uniref:Uncharacterized protein n=1 Tax=Chlamydomonas incerta TaxID=51695 RepID=A0A835SIL3_CHLIN|nr:hypothetical protein HXX76_012132 [Chlamydomonas incerta]|eukprot:KAG2427808.1 hypothetical protein HXX76_012132 [Chlamydomonas incerta]
MALRSSLGMTCDAPCDWRPQRDLAFTSGLATACGSSAGSRSFSPIVGSSSPSETPSLPDNIDIEIQTAVPRAVPQGQYNPFFSGFDPAPCLLAAALGGYGARLRAQPPSVQQQQSWEPFATTAFYTAPLAEQQVDWGTWRPLYARGRASGGNTW